MTLETHVDKATAWDELAKKNAEIKRLKRALAFVALWCWRDSKIGEIERFNAIKYHPSIKAFANGELGDGHSDLCGSGYCPKCGTTP
jgi:hypothetical protein